MNALRLALALVWFAPPCIRAQNTVWHRQSTEDGLAPILRGTAWTPVGKTRELHTHFEPLTLPAKPGSRITAYCEVTIAPAPTADIRNDILRIGLFAIHTPTPREGDHEESTAEGFMLRMQPAGKPEDKGTAIRKRTREDKATKFFMTGSSQWNTPEEPQPGLNIDTPGSFPVILELERGKAGEALARAHVGDRVMECPLPGLTSPVNTLCLSTTNDTAWQTLRVENVSIRRIEPNP